MQLPVFPEGVSHITSELAFKREGNRITYFNGTMPVFVHEADDTATFRMITSQFCVNGNAKQAEIVRAFGITSTNMKRAVKLYRARGPQGFYAPRRTRGPAVLTPAVLEQAQQKLDTGESVPDVAELLGIKRNTLQKAVRACRLRVTSKKKSRR